MRVVHLTSAELTARLKTARGRKRLKILDELQRRFDETTPHWTSGPNAAPVPRYNYAIQHAEPLNAQLSTISSP